MNLLASLGTTALLLVYFYYQDRNREPLRRLMEAFFVGAALSLQVSFLQDLLPLPGHILFAAFISAGLVEEGIKLIALRLTLFRSKDFTQAVDGITYAVFLGLGFATVENLYYIASVEIGIVRAVTAVPAHALFAVAMGYYLGKYRFSGDKTELLLALYMPVILHGVYNYLILSGTAWGLFLFVPYLVFLWWLGMFKHAKLNEKVRKIAKDSGLGKKE